MRKLIPALGGLAILVAFPTQAREFFIGGPVKQADMEIVANYLKGVAMAPMPGAMADMAPMAAMADSGGGDAVHLEADIHATADNAFGYGDGAWIPYLTVHYDLKKTGADWHATGKLIPMTATDGPHYAANVAMGGPGDYSLSYVIDPPDSAIFGRHIDKATGVPEWWKPITVTFNFKYPQT